MFFLAPYLQLQDKVHAITAQRVDVVEQQSDDDVNAVTLMQCYGVLQGKHLIEGFIIRDEILPVL